MKVLYSHHGMKGKNGWGRTFYMAQGLADLGHVWGIERSGFFNGREKWAKGFENQRV